LPKKGEKGKGEREGKGKREASSFDVFLTTLFTGWIIIILGGKVYGNRMQFLPERKVPLLLRKRPFPHM
jgi:hypothetical protein